MRDRYQHLSPEMYKAIMDLRSQRVPWKVIGKTLGRNWETLRGAFKRAKAKGMNVEPAA